MKIKKILFAFKSKQLFRAALNLTFASIEHLKLLKNFNFNTILDVGANKGQFSLLVKYLFPNTKIIAFEPLENEAKIFNKIFSNDKFVTLYNIAIGQSTSEGIFHISARNDSSSLLPISEKQIKIFPGTKEVKTERISIVPLSKKINASVFKHPTLMKIDVQGFELEVLKGSIDILNSIDFILIEVSFIELYTGQALSNDIIVFLLSHKYQLIGVYNMTYNNGIAVQADFFFKLKK